MSALLELVPNWLLLAAGITLLLLGGHWLVIGAVAVATRMGFSTLMIGLTIVAFGTSAPELAFNIVAALTGNPELSFGNVVGSNIANIGLVLAAGAVLAPLAVHSQVVRKELPWLLVVTIGLVLLPFGPFSNIANGASPLDGFVRWHGAVMLLGFVAVTWTWYRMGRRGQKDLFTEELAEAPLARTGGSLAKAGGVFALGLGALLVGARLAEHGAVGIAAWLGLSKAVIGLTIVAVSTSLPELATTWAACRRGHTDLAVGNIVGSNLFNILLVLGLTALIAPVPVPQLATEANPLLSHGVQDLACMAILTLVLLPIALTGGNRITRFEGSFLLVIYVLYMTWSVAREKLL